MHHGQNFILSTFQPHVIETTHDRFLQPDRVEEVANWIKFRQKFLK